MDQVNKRLIQPPLELSSVGLVKSLMMSVPVQSPDFFYCWLRPNCNHYNAQMLDNPMEPKYAFIQVIENLSHLLLQKLPGPVQNFKARYLQHLAMSLPAIRYWEGDEVFLITIVVVVAALVWCGEEISRHDVITLWRVTLPIQIFAKLSSSSVPVQSNLDWD